MLQTGLRAALAAAISFALCQQLSAHDGPLKHWLESLLRPDNDQHPSRQLDRKSLFCCGEADIVKTRFRVENTGGAYPEDQWYAWLNEFVDVDSIGENPQRVLSERRSLSVRVGWHNPMLCTAERRTLSATYHDRLTSELRRDAGANLAVMAGRTRFVFMLPANQREIVKRL